MAYFRKMTSGRYRVEVCKHNIKKSATFDTKAEAKEWAAEMEVAVKNAKSGKIPNKTFGDLLKRYSLDVSPKKATHKKELKMLARLSDSFPGTIKLSALDESHVSWWRDKRLKEVLPSTVARDWNTLSNACTVAVKEWRWLKKNPFSNVKKPTSPPPRDRRISDHEIEQILFALNYSGAAPTTKKEITAAAFLFAIETAMRAGEILGLEWSDIDLSNKFLRIRGGKTAAAKREVALSNDAVKILTKMKKTKNKGEQVFNVKSSVLDILFRRAKVAAEIDDLHFHDTRHEAITRLAQKIDVLDLARMVGHKDLKMLMVYYNKSAADIAKSL